MTPSQEVFPVQVPPALLRQRVNGAQEHLKPTFGRRVTYSTQPGCGLRERDTEKYWRRVNICDTRERAVATLPMQNETPDEPNNNRRKNIFEDPAIAEAGKDDPFARFVLKYWRLLVTGLIAVGLSIVGYNQFMTTALQKRADATKILHAVQEQYQDIVKKQAAVQTLRADEKAATDDKVRAETAEKITKESEELQKQRDKINLMLVGLESPPPFNTFASLYRGLTAARFGDYDTTASILASLNWEQVGKPESPERSAAELAALGLANALVDSDKHLDQVKTTLQLLAEKGQYASVGAVDTLSILATTPEDKERVRGLIQGVQQRYPAEQKFLQDASERVAS